ncbi:TPA: hypothetical protein ACIZAI_001906 [Legionella pneumophila]
MSDINQNPVKNLGVFSVLDAATEIKFFLLAVAFVLWVDNVFLYFHQPAILELMRNSTLQNASLSFKLIFILVAFSFMTSIVLPVFCRLANELYLQFLWNGVEKIFGFDQRNYETPSDYVYAHELQKAAHVAKDKFLIDIYNAYEKVKIERERSINKIASLALCNLFLLCINYFHYGQENTVSKSLLTYSGSSQLIWFCIAGLLLLVFIRFHIDDRQLVFCPGLYQDLDEKKKQNFPQTEPREQIRNSIF